MTPKTNLEIAKDLITEREALIEKNKCYDCYEELLLCKGQIIQHREDCIRTLEKLEVIYNKRLKLENGDNFLIEDGLIIQDLKATLAYYDEVLG